jgi:hypothetical protein
MIWSARKASEATRKKHMTMREIFSFIVVRRSRVLLPESIVPDQVERDQVEQVA